MGLLKQWYWITRHRVEKVQREMRDRRHILGEEVHEGLGERKGTREGMI